jgi:hypothetical protein
MRPVVNHGGTACAAVRQDFIRLQTNASVHRNSGYTISHLDSLSMHGQSDEDEEHRDVY